MFAFYQGKGKYLHLLRASTVQTEKKRMTIFCTTICYEKISTSTNYSLDLSNGSKRLFSLLPRGNLKRLFTVKIH